MTVTVAVPPTSVPVTVGPPATTKVTVPVGVPSPNGRTVAVSVTGCPKTAGFGDADAKVKVGAMEWPSGWCDGGGPFSSRGA
ncbi:hypothetical protein HEK616_33130 [Streptomyces nigrescens]|uniref:Uncharacterized protein n=1 Tax=Streptomyces nigrescens TaxID=1920 RepID=A0ABM7ZTZ3_STRNI|nr:hypothetical protein HEK616_33130 [Streptomyces nigrescens]